MLRVLGMLLRRVGEPLRSKLKEPALRELRARHALDVLADDDLATLGARLSRAVGRATRFMRHLHLSFS